MDTKTKNPAAVALARLRAKKLTPERRMEISEAATAGLRRKMESDPHYRATMTKAATEARRKKAAERANALA